jgi:hypothetical protein
LLHPLLMFSDLCMIKFIITFFFVLWWVRKGHSWESLFQKSKARLGYYHNTWANSTLLYIFYFVENFEKWYIIRSSFVECWWNLAIILWMFWKPLALKSKLSIS